jgi:hypothetical protein
MTLPGSFLRSNRLACSYVILAATTCGFRVAAAENAPENPAEVSRQFAAEEKEGRLVITCGGRQIGDYVFADYRVRRPHFQNLRAMDGTQVTRRHPPVAGQDAVDHADMHPGLWLAFGDVGGEDFWRNKGTIRHDRFTARPAARDGRLTFAAENTLIARDGREMARQVSRFTLGTQPDAWSLLWEARFTPVVDNFYFGDQEEMGLGARVATPLTEKNGGAITGSTGDRTAKGTWGRTYDWCDYSGTIDGRSVGIALVPDPKNFRPCWWHNRDYGVFVANPFGRHAMKQGEVSRVDVSKGTTLTLRFGVLLHSSPSGATFPLDKSCRDLLKESANKTP